MSFAHNGKNYMLMTQAEPNLAVLVHIPTAKIVSVLSWNISCFEPCENFLDNFIVSTVPIKQSDG